MAVVLDSGHFEVFQYRFVGHLDEEPSPLWSSLTEDNWKSKLIGHLGDGKVMLPFVFHKKVYLLLLLGSLRNSGRDTGNDDIARILSLYYY